MPMTDAMRQLIATADNPAQVFWRGDEIEVLFPFDMSHEQHLAAREKITALALKFGGIFAMVNGNPVCKVASAEAIPAMTLAAPAYTHRVAEKMITTAEQSLRVDGAEWLKFMENLWNLEDPRGRN